MSGLRILARTCRARGIASTRGFAKKAKAKGDAAKATAAGDFGGASSVGADTRSEDAPPGSEDAGSSEARSEPGTAGEAADEAARAARAAFLVFVSACCPPSASRALWRTPGT